jgi:hypothetical protein
MTPFAGFCAKFVQKKPLYFNSGEIAALPICQLLFVRFGEFQRLAGDKIWIRVFLGKAWISAGRKQRSSFIRITNS